MSNQGVRETTTKDMSKSMTKNMTARMTKGMIKLPVGDGQDIWPKIH